MSVRRSSSSKKGRGNKKRMTVPRSNQKMGFHFLDVEGKKARLTREGTIGGRDEDGGYTLEAFDLRTESVDTQELFSDQGARFTAELMKFYGDNFDIYSDNWSKAFESDRRNNAFATIPNVTRGAFYWGEILNDDGDGILYTTPEGKITDKFSDENDVAQSGDVWYGYTISIEDPEFGRDRKGLIDLLDLTNDFYKKFEEDEVIGYIIKNEKTGQTYFSTRVPTVNNDEEFHNKTVLRSTKGMKVSGGLKPIADGQMTYTEVKPTDVFRMKINEQFISPATFKSAKFGEKFVILNEALEINRENPTITMEFNLEYFETLADAHIVNADDVRVPVSDELDRHPAYVAHSTTDKASDLARLQWMDIVRRDLEKNDYIPIFETTDIVRTKVDNVGLHRREKGFFFTGNNWKDDLTTENVLKTSKQREKDESAEKMSISGTDKKVVFL